MPFKIPPHHFSVELVEKVGEDFRNYFANHPVKYFVFLRFFQDGSCIQLSTAPQNLFSILEEDLPLSVPYKDFYASMKSYVYFCEEELSEVYLMYLKERFKVCHSLRIVNRHENYLDVFGVSMDHYYSQAGTYYFNNISKIRNFVEDFLNKNKSLITDMTNKRIILPPSLQLSNLNQLLLPLKQPEFYVENLGKSISLSPNEVKCMEKICRGKTYKEVALELKISPRTVETYLNRIREKTGLRTKASLRKLIMDSSK